MSEQAHTPGPWESGRSTGRLHQIGIDRPLNDDGAVDPIGCAYGNVDSKETKANASVMAAAPDLLEELEESNAYMERVYVATGSNSPGLKAQIDRNRAAIAKAKGEQP